MHEVLGKDAATGARKLPHLSGLHPRLAPVYSDTLRPSVGSQLMPGEQPGY
jgi:hypothetical protein